MKIKFCGAAEGVTGSCHMVTTKNHKFLLDCGLFQGGKKEDELNFEPFPFDPKEIEYVILSHAHIDHCGRLPLLVKRGFVGDIYCTDATYDLLGIMLRDSAYIQEKEAEWQNRKNERAGRQLVDPLYVTADAEATLKYLKPILYDQQIAINEEVKIVFNEAGHILGSSIVELWVSEDNTETKIVFSGDLGVEGRPILRDPTIIKKADYVIMESTYGNRVHGEKSTGTKQLLDIVRQTTKRGGNTVIPAFAVGRTQELIYEFNKWYDGDNEYSSELRDVNVYVDSPMATNTTEVFKKNAQVFDDETRDYIMNGDHPLEFENLKFTRSVDDSRALNFDRKPKVIISASGMCEAGRIRHHLKHNLWDPKSSIVFVGYQAEGTLGRYLKEGATEVKLFGETIQVKAEIHNLEGFSGHADRDDLMEWIGGFKEKPKKVFLVHGEADSKNELATLIEKDLGIEVFVVSEYTEVELDKSHVIGQSEKVTASEKEKNTDELRELLAGIHQNIEGVIYKANLASSKNIEDDKLVKLKNEALELEKAMVNLAAAVTNDITTEFDIAAPIEAEDKNN